MTWTVIEGTWLVIALAAAGWNGWALADALGDRQTLRASGCNGLRRIEADTAVRVGWLLVGGPLVFLLMGLVALAAPDPATPPTVNSLFFVGQMFLVNVIFAGAGVSNRVGRRRAIDYGDETDRQDVAFAEGKAAAQKEQRARTRLEVKEAKIEKADAVIADHLHAQNVTIQATNVNVSPAPTEKEEDQ